MVLVPSICITLTTGDVLDIITTSHLIPIKSCGLSQVLLILNHRAEGVRNYPQSSLQHFKGVCWVVKVGQVQVLDELRSSHDTMFAIEVLPYVMLFFFVAVNFAAGAGIDLSSLSIVQGKVCWDLYIDGLVVSSDGNLLDALGAAIKVYHFSSYACTKF